MHFFNTTSNTISNLNSPLISLSAFMQISASLNAIRTDLEKKIPKEQWKRQLKKFHSFMGEQPLPPRYYVYFLQQVKEILEEDPSLEQHYSSTLKKIEDYFNQDLKKETRKLVAYFAVDVWQALSYLKQQPTDNWLLGLKKLRESLRFYKAFLPRDIYQPITSSLDDAADEWIWKKPSPKKWHQELLDEIEFSFLQIPSVWQPPLPKTNTKTKITAPASGVLFTAFLSVIAPASAAISATANSNAFTLPTQRNSHLYPLNNNQTLAVWQSITTLNAALLDNNGTLIKNVLSENTSDQAFDFCALPLSEGGFIIVWCDNQQTVTWQVFNAQGNFFRTFTIPETSGIFQSSPSLAQISDTTLLLVWQYQSNSASYLMKQTLTLAGLPQGSPTRMNSLDNTFQMNPALVALQPEGSLLAWCVRGQSPTDPTHLYAQRLDAQGQLLYTPTALGTTDSNQLYPTTTALVGGEIIVTWQQSPLNNQPSRIYAQLFDAKGHVNGTAFQVSQLTTEPISEQAASVTPLPNGNALINWLAQASGNPLMDISARIFEPNGQPYGTDTIFLRTIENNVAVIPSFGNLLNGNLMIGPEIGNNITASVIDTQIYVQNAQKPIRYGEDETFIFQSPLQISTPPFAKITAKISLSDTHAGTLSSLHTPQQLPSFTWSMTDTVANVNQALTSLQFKPGYHYYKNITIAVDIDNGFVVPSHTNISAIGYPIDHGPQIQFPIPDQILETSTPFTYTIPSDTFTDEYNDIVAYEVFLTDGRPLAATKWLSFDSKTNTLSGTPSNFEKLRVTVRAIDSRNLSVDDAFDITFKGIDPRFIFTFIGGSILALAVVFAAAIAYRHRQRTRQRRHNMPFKSDQVNHVELEEIRQSHSQKTEENPDDQLTIITDTIILSSSNKQSTESKPQVTKTSSLTNLGNIIRNSGNSFLKTSQKVFKKASTFIGGESNAYTQVGEPIEMEQLNETIADNSNKLEVNSEYYYEEIDINFLLNVKIKNHSEYSKHVEVFAAIDNMFLEQFQNYLKEIAKPGYSNKTILIPLNLGCYHWLGLLIELKQGKVERAICFDPLGVKQQKPQMLGKIEEFLLNTFENAKLDFQDVLLQPDKSSCGALVVEGFFRLIDKDKRNETKKFTTEEIKDIRLEHLALIKKTDETHFDRFYSKQKDNKSTVQAINKQLYQLAELGNVRFSNTEWQRIFEIAENLAGITHIEAKKHLTDAFKYDSQYDADLQSYWREIRRGLKKAKNTHELKHHEAHCIRQLFHLLFGITVTNLSGAPSLKNKDLKITIEMAKTISEIVKDETLAQQKWSEFTKQIKQQIEADREYALELQNLEFQKAEITTPKPEDNLKEEEQDGNINPYKNTL